MCASPALILWRSKRTTFILADCDHEHVHNGTFQRHCCMYPIVRDVRDEGGCSATMILLDPCSIIGRARARVGALHKHTVHVSATKSSDGPICQRQCVLGLAVHHELAVCALRFEVRHATFRHLQPLRAADGRRM